MPRVPSPRRILTVLSESTSLRQPARSKRPTTASPRNTIRIRTRTPPPKTNSPISNPHMRFYPTPKSESNLINSALPDSTLAEEPPVATPLAEASAEATHSVVALVAREVSAVVSTLRISFPHLPDNRVPLAAAVDGADEEEVSSRRSWWAKTSRFRPASLSWKPPRARAKRFQSRLLHPAEHVRAAV